MAASCKDLKCPAGPGLAPPPALRPAPVHGVLLWHAAPGPRHWSGMGFHPELCHDLYVSRLLGTWEADARVRTADLRAGAIPPLEPGAGDCVIGSYPHGTGLSQPVGVEVPGSSYTPSGPQFPS